jgi:hydroxymethylglutaryl-CoA lyase
VSERRSAVLDHLPDRVSIYEVSPRDGLQNEKVTVPLGDKVRLIDALVSAGLRRIEVTSFVSPKWIPQLADADDLARKVVPPPGVTFSALCPNVTGLARAKAAGMKEIGVFVSASETHNQKNVNKTVAGTLAVFEETIGPARDAGLQVRGYVSTVWGCPYEGTVDPEHALRIAKRLLDMGCYQISLGDTIGVGTPRQTKAILERMLGEIPAPKIAMHMHDTRGTALVNILVGLELGIRDFDASVGGLGGCPYAPGAAGNCATEDLVYMLQGMGIESGVDLERLVEAGRAAESIVGRKLPGKVHQSGVRSLRA